MIEIRPLREAIGAEVRGVALDESISEKDAMILRSAFAEHVLLIFRGVELDDLKLKTSADWLGSIGKIHMPFGRRRDEDLNIQLVSNIRNEFNEEIGSFGDSDMWFHHDNSFSQAPDKATWLYSVELPETGGNTLFNNCYLSWEALPYKLKTKIAGKKVLQVYDYTVKQEPDLSDLARIPHCWQPAVLIHPETNRPALYVNRLMSATIQGMDKSDASDLLQDLFHFIERVDYEHTWSLSDYLIWDNRCSAHARTSFPPEQRRLLKRGKVAGEILKPFGYDGKQS